MSTKKCLGKNISRLNIFSVTLILVITLAFTLGNNVAFASDNSEPTTKEIEKVELYCEEYDVEMSYDNEFVNEVQSMLDEREKYSGINTRSSSSSGNPIQKSRFIPTSAYADIIWTNNPISPFNHVGLYTKTDKITEALSGGVKTRTVGKSMKEYPFKIYKVTKKTDPSSRYALSNRQKVTTWGVAQVGKKYDSNFANNKLNTTANNEKMNCSELVWKAWEFKMDVDLDSNGGKGVYPNNIKESGRTKLLTSG